MSKTKLLCYAMAGALLGQMVSHQWLLSDIFFGTDYLNWLLSLAVIRLMVWLGSSMNWSHPLAFMLFVLLVVFEPQISFYLHSFPDYTTLGKYVLLAVAVLSLVASQPSGIPYMRYQVVVVVFSFVLMLCCGWRIALTPLLVVAALGLGFWELHCGVQKYMRLYWLAGSSMVLSLLVVLPDVTIYESQSQYYDPVIYSITTAFQRIDVTHWKGENWYYHNSINHFSSVDSWMYYEPLVHPVMSFAPKDARILIVGGENGMALHEVLKYPTASIDLLPLDTLFLSLSRENKLFSSLHEESLDSKRLQVLSHDVFEEISTTKKKYDVIILDMPDPTDTEINQYYTQSFYTLCYQALQTNGLLITQSGSPYFATKAYAIIKRTLQSVGFRTTQLHNQILTVGEWGWTIGITDSRNIDSLLRLQGYDNITTHWINREANQMMLSFGKSSTSWDSIVVNTIAHPTLYHAYNQGNWQLTMRKVKRL